MGEGRNNGRRGGSYPLTSAEEIIFEINDIGVRNQLHYLQLSILRLERDSGRVP